MAKFTISELCALFPTGIPLPAFVLLQDEKLPTHEVRRRIEEMAVQTTPTRDEAVRGAAELFDELRCRMLTCDIPQGEHPIHTFDRCVTAMLASAPAPASGRVDAVILRIREMWDEDECPSLDRVDPLLDELRASLSPAATPVSEAGGERKVAFFKDGKVEDAIAALAKPASSPAGGDSVALRNAAEEFCRRVEAGEIRSKRSYAAFKAALAKPAGGDVSELDHERWRANAFMKQRDRIVDRHDTVREIVAKMRADMEKIGGFENGLLAVPADGIRSYIEQLEAAIGGDEKP